MTPRAPGRDLARLTFGVLFIGLLLGVRSYAAPGGDFRCGETLRVEVVESSEDEEGRAVFDCTISRAGERLASGALTVYQPLDGTFLEAECARDD